MEKLLNSAADVQGLAANRETTETGTMSNVQVITNGYEGTQFLLMLLLREFAIEKRGYERSTKERLSVEELGLMEVIRRIADNILFDVTKAIDYDEENHAFKLNATEGMVELEVDTYFDDELHGCNSRKMFILAMDAYLHTQKTCTMLIDNLLYKSLIIDFEGYELSGYDDNHYPIFTVSFSWEIRDCEGNKQFVDSSTKNYVFD